jgi:predicted nucleic acid-binding protein
VIVVDASAVVELLLQTATGRRVARRIAARSQGLHAPHLVDVEVLQVLRRWEARGVLPSGRAAEAVADLVQLDLRRHPHDILSLRIWELRANVTAYDAAYLALAEALRAPLLTTDERLSRAPGHRATVEVA